MKIILAYRHEARDLIYADRIRALDLAKQIRRELLAPRQLFPSPSFPIYSQWRKNIIRKEMNAFTSEVSVCMCVCVCAYVCRTN